MRQKNLLEIELKVREILEKVLGDIDSIIPPINLAKILQHYKLNLSMAGFKDPSASGAYYEPQKMIYLSKSDSPKRQAFTIAHELGHLILNHKKKFDIFYRHQANQFNGQTKEEEKQANYFAAALLMPQELVERSWGKTKDIELLAAHFGVSKPAAYWRLKNLGLI